MNNTPFIYLDTVFSQLVSGETNFFDNFRWENSLKVSK
jgi:hypothetical protein